MEVNNTSILKYPCSKYIEQPREAMVRRLTQDDKNTILRIFMEDLDTLMTQLTTGAHHEHKVLVLTEPLCELPVREQIFRDIVAKYGKDAQVILKPHPRDVLDYHKLFPDDIVLDGKFPMEILNFIEGLEFDQVVSVYTVPDSIHFAKEKVFLGMTLWICTRILKNTALMSRFLRSSFGIGLQERKERFHEKKFTVK